MPPKRRSHKDLPPNIYPATDTRDRAGLSGFVFHDTRHTAATWMAQKLHVLELCKVFGWKNPAQAMTYYNPKASDIATRMV